MKLLVCLCLCTASVWGQEKPTVSSAPVSSPVTVTEKLAVRELQVELKDLQLQIQELVTRATDVQGKLKQKVIEIQEVHSCRDCQLDARLDWVKPAPQMSRK